MASRFMPLPGCRIELQPVEAGQIESPGILRRDRVDAYAEQSVRQRLVHLDDVFMHAANVSQITGITDARQLRFFLDRRSGRENNLWAP